MSIHLEQAITALQERKKAPSRLTRNNILFKTIIKAIQDKKGANIVSLDLKKLDEAVADFFILCEADSHLQIKAIRDNIVSEVMQASGERPYHVEEGEQWSLIDYVNVVVHIFQGEYRKFYDLESLWMDAGRAEHDL